MNLRRYSIVVAFALIALLLQIVPVFSNLTAAADNRCNWAGFVTDVTIRDGSVLKIGQGFFKTWRLKNIGTCPWSTAYSVVYASGPHLSYPESFPLSKDVKPGETIDITVSMQAPITPGHYRSYWQLKSASGELFGIGSSANTPFYADFNSVDHLGNVYDFATNLCEATWRNTSGVLPCPGTDGDNRGFSVKSSLYRMENGADFQIVGLLLSPENKYNGSIQGTYPEFTVQVGDRFQGMVGCEYGSSCSVTFRLDYQVGDGPMQTFWSRSETNDGSVYRVDVGLSSLAGKTVKFTLTLFAAGSATGDRAIWAFPFIVRTGGVIDPTATAIGPTLLPSVTRTVTPSATITATPVPPVNSEAYYDFTANICAATWRSGAGSLPCQNNGDARGFAARVESPRLEDNVVDPLPGMLFVPENKYNGYIQGTYPEFTVQQGDHFQALVGCEYGKACYVTYRLEYEIGNTGPVILWNWSEKNDQHTYRVDRDLSTLAGKKVKFTLTLLAAGPATNDFAIWGHPRLIRSGTISPTPTWTATATGPTPTSSATGIVTPMPPIPGAYYDFSSNACAASWESGAGALPCPGLDDSPRGFALPVINPKLENGMVDNAPGLILFPQNKYDGYIKGVYPEIAVQAGDRFQSIVNCAYGSACYVTFRLDYRVGTGPVYTFWAWKEKNEGQYYRVNLDLSSLAGKKVKFILTLLATGPATGDRALWSQPRIVRSGYVSPTPTVTPTPTLTSESFKVIGVTANATKLGTDICGQPNPVEISGTITTNGPTTVTFHWEMRGDKTNTTSDEVITFSSAGTQNINEGAYKVDCGNYSARLVVTSPNAFDAITYYSVNPSTVTPSPTSTVTATATPQGSVTNVTAIANLPELVDCLRAVNVDLVGNITTNGPATVKYHWEIGTDATIKDTTVENTLSFASASTQAANLPGYGVYCGNNFARLVVTSPNAISAQANFPLTQLTVLPIYNFSTFKLIGTMDCSGFETHTWSQDACNGESGGCWISQTPLFGVAYAGFFRWEGNKICGLGLP
jgi:hypothetical protein